MKYLYYTFILLFAVACQEKNSEQNSNLSYTNVDIPVNEVQGISAEFVDSVTFVKLNEPENTFRVLNRLQIYNDTMYILDRRSYKLLSFDMQGNYIAQYGVHGKAKSEYLKATAFDVDDRFVYLYDRAGKKMLYFTHTGQFVKSVSTEFRGEEFKVLADGGFIFSLEREDSDIKLCLTDGQFNIGKVFLTFDKNDKNNYSSASLFQEVGDSIYYTDDLSDTTYVFTNRGKLAHYYHFKFSSYSLPTDMRYDAEKLVDSKSGKKYAYMNACPLICGTKLIVPMKNRNVRTVLYYDLKEQKGGNKAIDHSLSSTDIVTPLCIYNGCVVGSLESYCLDRFAGNGTLPLDVVQHIEDGNRVIVFYRLKH